MWEFFKNLGVKIYTGIYGVIDPKIRQKFDIDNALQISTVYTCVKILAETLARLPLNIYNETEKGKIVNKQDNLYPLLHYSPNNIISSYQFFLMLETFRNLKGNSYAKIVRNKRTGIPISLEIIYPSNVKSVNFVNNQLYYKVNILQSDGNYVEEVLNSKDILHFKGISDGIFGYNPIEALYYNLSTTFQGISTIDSFYANNITAPRAIESTVSGANQKAINEAVDKLELAQGGSIGSGKLIKLPPNCKIVDLALNFADAQIIETLKFNKADIACLFGVPPHLVGLFEASKFNSVELMQLDFKANTLSSITNMYRRELEFKLLTTEERNSGKSIEWNLNALIETDLNSKMNAFKTYIQNGVYTPNEVRILEGLPTFEGGDDHFIMSNMMSLEKYNAGLVTPGQTNTQIQDTISSEDVSIN